MYSEGEMHTVTGLVCSGDGGGSTCTCRHLRRIHHRAVLFRLFCCGTREHFVLFDSHSHKTDGPLLGDVLFVETARYLLLIIFSVHYSQTCFFSETLTVILL